MQSSQTYLLVPHLFHYPTHWDQRKGCLSNAIQLSFSYSETSPQCWLHLTWPPCFLTVLCTRCALLVLNISDMLWSDSPNVGKQFKQSYCFHLGGMQSLDTGNVGRQWMAESNIEVNSKAAVWCVMDLSNSHVLQSQHSPGSPGSQLTNQSLGHWKYINRLPSTGGQGEDITS